MRGPNAEEIEANVNFIYQGYVNIYQEDLENFLALSEELQLKGLTADLNTDTNTESKINLMPQNQRENQ